MAWPTITGYTAGEKVIAKAELTEASAKITAIVAAHKVANGTDSRVENELLAYKAIIDARNTAIV